tara:strand:+ start:621 stop:1028 length:408 start_codon:yes stop_codon:yes gene_type:complete
MAKRTRTELENPTRIYTDADLRFKISSDTPHEIQFQQWLALRNVLGFYNVDGIDWGQIDDALEQLKEDPSLKITDVLSDGEYRDVMNEITTALKEYIDEIWQNKDYNKMADKIEVLQKQAGLFQQLNKIGFFVYL